MPLRLRRQDLRRRALADGELALEYVGPTIKWTSHIEGHRPGILATVTRDDIALPSTLETCAADAGIELADHPAIPRLRRLVAVALLASHRARAPELIEELSGLEVWWSPGAKGSAEAAYRRALDAVDRAVREIALDLAARARRRRAHEIMSKTFRVPEAQRENLARILEEAPTRPPADPPEDRATAFSEPALEEMRRDIEEARRTDMPQRLPGGARRSLFRLAPGVYLVEDGLLCPKATLREALEQASDPRSRARSRTVLDWDGEWPVMVRSYGEKGAPAYRLDRALKRFLAEQSAREEAPRPRSSEG